MTARHKVLLTSNLVTPTPEQMAAFDGLDIEFVSGAFPTEDALIAAARDADGILVVMEDFNARVLASLERCKVLSRFGIGVDTIDVAAATARGIAVCNVPDANHNEVATHAIAMALSLTRRLGAFNALMRAGGWGSFQIGGAIRRPHAQVFGLIGMGRIGSRVAEIAAAIGFQVWAYDPALPPEAMTDVGVKPVSLEELIAGADVLSLHIPLSEGSRNIIGAAALSRMKPTAVLVNVSRGGLVDEDALYEALKAGRLAGAALDVFAVEPPAGVHKLASLDNVILTPHAAHYSREAMVETSQRTFENAALVLKGLPPHHRVN